MAQYSNNQRMDSASYERFAQYSYYVFDSELISLVSRIEPYSRSQDRDSNGSLACLRALLLRSFCNRAARPSMPLPPHVTYGIFIHSSNLMLKFRTLCDRE
jgi:hypothetical protein